MELTPLERTVLEKLLAGDHPALSSLRAQLLVTSVESRQLTGVGFFADLTVAEAAPIVNGDAELADVHAAIAGVQGGLGFVLFIRNGRLSLLEGYTFGEPWPASVDGFVLSYQADGREEQLRQLDRL